MDPKIQQKVLELMKQFLVEPIMVANPDLEKWSDIPDDLMTDLVENNSDLQTMAESIYEQIEAAQPGGAYVRGGGSVRVPDIIKKNINAIQGQGSEFTEYIAGRTAANISEAAASFGLDLNALGVEPATQPTTGFDPSIGGEIGEANRTALALYTDINKKISRNASLIDSENKIYEVRIDPLGDGSSERVEYIQLTENAAGDTVGKAVQKPTAEVKPKTKKMEQVLGATLKIDIELDGKTDEGPDIIEAGSPIYIDVNDPNSLYYADEYGENPVVEAAIKLPEDPDEPEKPIKAVAGEKTTDGEQLYKRQGDSTLFIKNEDDKFIEYIGGYQEDEEDEPQYDYITRVNNDGIVEVVRYNIKTNTFDDIVSSGLTDAQYKLQQAQSDLDVKEFNQSVIEFDQTLAQRKAEADALETQRGFQNQLEQDKFNVDRELGFQAQALDEAEFNVQQLQFNASMAENARQFDEANRLNALAQQEQARATNIQTGFQINQARAQALDQVRDILRNPADYLARGFALAGQDAPFTPVTQADLINQVSSEYNAYNDFLTSMGTGFNAQEYLAGRQGARPDLQIQAPSMKDYRQQRAQMIASGGRPEGGITQEDLDYYTTDSGFTDYTGDGSFQGSSALGEFFANNPDSPSRDIFWPGGDDWTTTPPEAEHGGMFGNPVIVGDSSSGKENQELVMSADGAPMVVLPLTDQQIDILQGKRNNKMPKAQTGGMFGSQDFVGFGQRMGNVGFGGVMYNQLPSRNITQQDIIERAERFGTPRVSRVAQGFRPQPMQFGFPLMTPGQLGSLTPDEREELRTRLASRNVSLGDVETAVMQRFGPTGTRRERRRF